MAPLDVPLPADFPPELAQAVACEAAEDADRVGLFLRELNDGLARRGLQTLPRRLPAGLLLGLGAALRLLAWEGTGSRAHLPADLPPAMKAIRDLFAALGKQPASLEARGGELVLRVVRAWVDHFAWHGRAAWGADLVLGGAEEDALVDALAEFLWANRHALSAQGGEQP